MTTKHKRALNKKAQFKLRMLEPLRLKIERAAKARGASMNQEIVHRLNQSFESDKTVDAINLAVTKAMLRHCAVRADVRMSHPVIFGLALLVVVLAALALFR